MTSNVTTGTYTDIDYIRGINHRDIIILSTVIYPHKHKIRTIYSGPSSYDRLDIRTTWVTAKNFSFDLRPKS
jgi:hypothetical protein